MDVVLDVKEYSMEIFILEVFVVTNHYCLVEMVLATQVIFVKVLKRKRINMKG